MISLAAMSSPGWFCVRTQPKHEHIAAAHLRRALSEIEVFSPRLRIRKSTRRGAVWFVEALFPGYLFAKFEPASTMLAVKSSPGVRTIVTFGIHAPLVPDEVINHLRSQFDENESYEVPDIVREGDEVTIAGGPFHGLNAQVLRVMSAVNRVQVLLEFLGGFTRVEIGIDKLVTPKTPPPKLAK